MSTISSKIKQKALELGFDDCGIVKVTPLPEVYKKYNEYIKHGKHAGMNYLEKNLNVRANPELLVKNAKSVIMVAQNYFTENSVKSSFFISKYARGKDYHKVLKSRLLELLKFVIIELPDCKGRTFVDTAPFFERAYAVRAGLGQLGKNSCLIHPKHGSFVFLGEIIIDKVLDYDNFEVKDICGKCTKCIDACPTGALKPYSLDARKCISYHTIESQDEIPPNIVKVMNKNLLGCDICQDVCPHNQQLEITKITSFLEKSELAGLSTQEWNELDKKTYNKLRKGTAFARISYEKLRMILGCL